VKIISSKIEGNSSALDGGGIFAQKDDMSRQEARCAPTCRL
jgi:predicted outer membrane repeat protein